jgi:hypothetical protein
VAIEQLLFTYRPPGKGFNPKEGGFQIAACSPGISGEARDLLRSICMHYGDAVHTRAPAKAREIEDNWRTLQTERAVAMPPEVLDAFPVAWTYDRLADDQYALTRVQYTGLCPETDESGGWRIGNFLAHAYLFGPGDLASCRFNPLMLARSLTFATADTPGTTCLPSLSGFGPAAAGKSLAGEDPLAVLREAPFRNRVAEMAAALGDASFSTRPVVVCLGDWRGAAGLASALLDLLPPAIRCRTTFATYESNRDWLPQTDTARSGGWTAAHHLLVLCSGDSRATGLRADEVRGRFAVFNFTGDQFSDLGAPKPWAAFAAASVFGGQPGRLDQYFGLLEHLHLAADKNAWDGLVAAAALLEDQPPGEAIAAAAASLASWAVQPHQAHPALETLSPHVRRLAQADRPADVEALAPTLAALKDRASGAAGDAAPDGWNVLLREWIDEALAGGRARTASALLRACGPVRKEVLAAALARLFHAGGTPRLPPADQEDAKAMVGLLLEAVQSCEEHKDDATAESMLAAAFQTAGHCGLGRDLWERLGASHVQAKLKDPWDAAKQRLAESLLGSVSADSCPDANAWLRLRLLEATNPSGDALVDGLEKIAAACSRCAEREKLTQRAIAIANQRFPEPQQLAVQLGRMAEAAYGTPGEPAMLAAYRDAVSKVAAKRAWVHQRLAEAGAVQVLCREILAETIPWDADRSPGRLQTWRHEVLDAHAAVLDGLCRQVAGAVQEPGKFAGILPLAEQLLPKDLQKPSSLAPGAMTLFAAVVTGLPFQPPAAPWRRALLSTPDGLPAAAAARLRVFQFMLAIEERSRACDWSPASFPRSDPAWKRDARELAGGDKANLLTWCLAGFRHSGATAPSEALGLVQLLESMGEDSAGQVAQAFHQLLQGRDKVTWVLSATACVDAALAGSSPKVPWGRILGALLGRSDPMVRQLFLAHLERRFGPRSEERDARIEQLCVEAGLKEAKPPPPPPRNAPQPSPPGSGGSGWVWSRLFPWLLGHPDPPQPPPPERKQKGEKRK